MDALINLVGQTIAKLSYEQLKKRVDYVRRYEDNLERVQHLYEQLEDQHRETGKKVEEGERKNEEAVESVLTWLHDAEEQLKQFQSESKCKELLMDEDARKRAEKCCFGFVGWNPKYRHDLSRSAKKKADVIENIMKEMNDRGSYPVTSFTGPPELGIIEGNFCVGLQSREDMLNKIMDELKNNGKVNRIGIFGMGGAGKSTLVEEIARHAEQEKLFNKVVIAEIAQSPNILEIQNRIAERIGLPLTVHTKEERALQLSKQFMNSRESQTRTKRVSNNDEKQGETETVSNNDKKQGEGSGKLLVILDNLWDKLELRDLGISSQLENHLECKIIVTSRDEDVCKRMGVTNHYLYRVGDLSDAEARLLFKERVGEVVENEEYKDIMEKILMKCSRLPLTINVLVDRLKNQSLEVWEDIVQQLDKSILSEREGVLYSIYSVFKMSYNFIKSEKKKDVFLALLQF